MCDVFLANTNMKHVIKHRDHQILPNSVTTYKPKHYCISVLNLVIIMAFYVVMRGVSFFFLLLGGVGESLLMRRRRRGL